MGVPLLCVHVSPVLDVFVLVDLIFVCISKYIIAFHEVSVENHFILHQGSASNRFVFCFSFVFLSFPPTVPRVVALTHCSTRRG